MCGAEPAFPSFCHLLRSRHTSVTLRPCPNPSRVDMSSQQPLERRWERLRCAIPRPRSMAGPQRRLQASGVAHPQQSGRSRPSCGGDWAAGATQTDWQDRREPRCIAGRRIRVARQPRMLPTQSVLKPQPCTRAARTPRGTLRVYPFTTSKPSGILSLDRKRGPDEQVHLQTVPDRIS
jgi:hypothetical protein